MLLKATFHSGVAQIEMWKVPTTELQKNTGNGLCRKNHLDKNAIFPSTYTTKN